MKPKFPFEAAIFDLDGTLLESMYVWKRVDEVFFEKRGMTAPEDYGRALAGKSYRESAEYTVERFGLPESWQDLVREWTEQAIFEYAENVPLKRGAAQYLHLLKACGVKIAVATALPEYLYRPCLEHLGILNLFDALCSTDDTGGRGKASGEVYLLAAQKIGVPSEKCAVFEDVLEGVQGALRVGMRAYAVLDEAGAYFHDEMIRLAHESFAAYDEILPDMRAVVFTARCEGDFSAAYSPRENDYILCADAGYLLAKKHGITPDCIIGDFDSAEKPQGENVFVYPVEKDDPDTMLCVRHALKIGVKDILIVGGFGGRLDHTLANLQTLSFIAECGARAEMCDGKTRAFAIKNGSIRIERTSGKLSVFALGEKCSGVNISGAKYSGENFEIAPDFPLGMGNDFAADFACISVRTGTLTVICEREVY